MLNNVFDLMVFETHATIINDNCVSEFGLNLILVYNVNSTFRQALAEIKFNY